MQLGGWSDPASNWFKRVRFFCQDSLFSRSCLAIWRGKLSQTRTNLGEKPSRFNDTGMMSALFQIYISNTQARKKTCYITELVWQRTYREYMAHSHNCDFLRYKK